MEQKLKALIVDDAKISRLITRKIIEKAFTSDEAENGLIAVSKYGEAIATGAPYDIIFMDIVMPEMDGREAVKKIRELEENSGLERTPIVMISASDKLEEIEELVSGLLKKAINRQSLNEVLQKAFNGQISPL